MWWKKKEEGYLKGPNLGNYFSWHFGQLSLPVQEVQFYCYKNNNKS